LNGFTQYINGLLVSPKNRDIEKAAKHQ